ncbi:UDP-glucuronosyl/UDP-glucosyltransferase [Metarhizium album ARSEF 1941]|uniref:UDP-glucuronosyl/UDP-glucosyltransferase n=1 Tax=Metarhizium album (strain ARSEF 1941) TaxID=1081103 RepID=A0A0B2WL70_METAS|nr:UDP-glucuronosyl/UDP-glucosyltransferase [Metarhizium album ARSEF 1941]KHN93740.1 UDP-glucuronosyl/UDP-glucosyltransferase [Metarhizium album ARSEF 1941]
MRIAFVTNPASGEVNIQLATAQELVLQGHEVTFLSGGSCSRKIDWLRSVLAPQLRHNVHFINLGSGQAVDDFAELCHNRISSMRKPPGDPTSLRTCMEGALDEVEKHAAMAVEVCDYLNELDPDMVCVDALSSTLITGIRLTGRKFILMIPCSPGMTALSGALSPHPVAANRDGSWKTFLENLYLRTHEFIYSRTNKARIAKRRILLRRFGLRSYGTSGDTWLLPPHWEDDNCVAGIHFNTPGLLDCPKQPSKLVFVGAGVASNRADVTKAASCPEMEWMDEALALGKDVIYMNMGSMFIWQKKEFWACIGAFEAIYRKRQGRIRFLFKMNAPPPAVKEANPHLFSVTSGELPPYVRLTSWIEDQHAVYSHRALKLFVHHGGGNSFNEAVYFGVPQLILSQWLDTHEYAMCAEKFGIGLRSARPPLIQQDEMEARVLAILGPQWPNFKVNCQAWAMRSQIGGGTVSAAKIILGHAESAVLSDSSTVSLPLTPKAEPCDVKTMDEEVDFEGNLLEQPKWAAVGC